MLKESKLNVQWGKGSHFYDISPPSNKFKLWLLTQEDTSRKKGKEEQKKERRGEGIKYKDVSSTLVCSDAHLTTAQDRVESQCEIKSQMATGSALWWLWPHSPVSTALTVLTVLFYWSKAPPPPPPATLPFLLPLALVTEAIVERLVTHWPIGLWTKHTATGHWVEFFFSLSSPSFYPAPSCYHHQRSILPPSSFHLSLSRRMDLSFPWCKSLKVSNVWDLIFSTAVVV